LYNRPWRNHPAKASSLSNTIYDDDEPFVASPPGRKVGLPRLLIAQ
jgi:hypothetical protein